MKREDKPKDDASTKEKEMTSSNKRPVTSIVYVVVLLVGFVGIAALYLNSRSNISSKNNQISSLQSKIDTLAKGSIKPADVNAKDLPKPVNEPKPVGEPNPVSSSEPVPSPDCTGGSTYSADIGHFTIALNSPRVIIRSLDAGFEGGPITSLEIGSCIVGEDNVVETPPTAKVTILAHPSSSSADLRASYEAQSGSLTVSTTVTIDGVVAQKYTQDGLFLATAIYFDNAGVGYEITLSDTNATTQAILTDLITDWVFTP